MNRKSSVVACVAAAMAVAAVPLLAHHGAAAFETGQTVTVKGTMTKFLFVNPHSQLFFDVKNDKGETEMWQGEITAPTKLSRAGWSKNTLKFGDKVTVSGNPSKSNPHLLWIRKLAGPNDEALPLSED